MCLVIFSISKDSVTSQTPAPVQTNMVSASTSDESNKEDLSASIKPVPVSTSTAEVTETPRKPETENEKYVKNILASATKVNRGYSGLVFLLFVFWGWGWEGDEFVIYLID